MWHIPVLNVADGVLGEWEEGIFEDTGESALVECEDSGLDVLVFVDDLQSLAVSVERVHQNKRYVDL